MPPSKREFLQQVGLVGMALSSNALVSKSAFAQDESCRGSCPPVCVIA